MANNNLVDAFNIKKKSAVIKDTIDYDVFPDKEKLEELRTKIVQNLIDNVIPKNINELEETYQQMLKEGYPLDYLNLEYNIKEISSKVKYFQEIRQDTKKDIFSSEIYLST